MLCNWCFFNWDNMEAEIAWNIHAPFWWTEYFQCCMFYILPTQEWTLLAHSIRPLLIWILSFFLKLPNSVLCLVKNTMPETPPFHETRSGMGGRGPDFLMSCLPIFPGTLQFGYHIFHGLSCTELFMCLFLHLAELCWVELKSVALAGSAPETTTFLVHSSLPKSWWKFIPSSKFMREFLGQQGWELKGREATTWKKDFCFSSERIGIRTSHSPFHLYGPARNLPL